MAESPALSTKYDPPFGLDPPPLGASLQVAYEKKLVNTLTLFLFFLVFCPAQSGAGSQGLPSPAFLKMAQHAPCALPLLLVSCCEGASTHKRTAAAASTPPLLPLKLPQNASDWWHPPLLLIDATNQGQGNSSLWTLPAALLVCGVPLEFSH